jgi:hypothetical protein
MNVQERECQDGHNERKGPCSGTLEDYYSAMGTHAVRCVKHMTAHYAVIDGINERYPQHAPSDFDPSYAGERWDDDY